MKCHVCGGAEIQLAAGYETLCRVTSDCKPWPAGGGIGACPACGCVQKVIDDAWREQAGRIYSQYVLYQQSGGIEPAVFAGGADPLCLRSERLVEFIKKRGNLSETGRLLDIGYGNGALLRAFSAIAPQWSLNGTELDARYRAEVEKIPGVDTLYNCEPEKAPGEFDLITLVHVFEHIVDPVKFIEGFKSKLTPGGLIAVESPNHISNPFDLLIADHAAHYTLDTVRRTLESAGFGIVSISDDWIPKELTVLARNESANDAGSNGPAYSGGAFDELEKRVEWLKSVSFAARELSRSGPIGIFGSSIAASWLFGELDGAAAFFVDEDINRAGKSHLGIPILRPADVPAGSRIFIPLPHDIARGIAQRLSEGEAEYFYRE